MKPVIRQVDFIGIENGGSVRPAKTMREVSSLMLLGVEVSITVGFYALMSTLLR